MLGVWLHCLCVLLVVVGCVAEPEKGVPLQGFSSASSSFPSTFPTSLPDSYLSGFPSSSSSSSFSSSSFSSSPSSSAPRKTSTKRQEDRGQRPQLTNNRILPLSATVASEKYDYLLSTLEFDQDVYVNHAFLCPGQDQDCTVPTCEPCDWTDPSVLSFSL